MMPPAVVSTHTRYFVAVDPEGQLHAPVAGFGARQPMPRGSVSSTS